MANAYSTKLAEGFSSKLLKEIYEKSPLSLITNRDYEGEINGVGSKLNIGNIARVSEQNYTGSNLTADDIYENNSLLEITVKKSFYWKVKTIDVWKSYIKDPKSSVMQQKVGERLKNMSAFVLGFYGDVASGNRVGEDYTTGTVTVDVTTGAVTGAGTTFTSSMVGRGFKATGHTQWYRVKTFTDTTHIVIEDDLDDITSAYTGGAIGAGATYIIEAVTATTITTSNILAKVASLREKLDIAERYGKSAVPDEGRFLIAPPEFFTKLIQGSGIALHVPEVYTDLVKRGFMGMLDGFMLFKSNALTGNNTDGFRVIAGHSDWITFADKLLETGIEDLIGNFGSAYKDLFVYGAKVPDVRRHYATEGFWKF